MNINQYKSSMESIYVKKLTINELLDKKDNTIKLKVKSLTYALLGVLIIFFVSQSKKPEIIITAYAAEKEIQLTDKFIDIKLNSKPIYGQADQDNSCFINFDLYFKCEGQNIESISYTCSDQIISMDNYESAKAYYVENLIIPASEYKYYINANNFIYGYHMPGDNSANITKLIGETYSVNYEDQNNQYNLIIAGVVDNAGIFHINDTTIKIAVKLIDGTIKYKNLIIKSEKDVLSDIQIRIS